MRTRWEEIVIGTITISALGLGFGGLFAACAGPGGRQATIDHNPVTATAQVEATAETNAAVEANAEVNTSVEANAAIRGDLTAALARIEKLEASLVAVKTGDIQTGDVGLVKQGDGEQSGGVRIGGGGDSITSWIREIGWTLMCIGYYPCVHRPIRKWRERRNGHGCEHCGQALYR